MKCITRPIFTFSLCQGSPRNEQKETKWHLLCSGMKREENHFSSIIFNFVTRSVTLLDAVLFHYAYICPTLLYQTCMNKTAPSFLACLHHFYCTCFSFPRKESFHFSTCSSPRFYYLFYSCVSFSFLSSFHLLCL